MEDNPWGPVPEQQRMHEAAREQRDAARIALREALDNAPWGQNGAVFITDRALLIGSPDRVKTLYINGVPRATVVCQGRSNPRLSEVLTVQEGREIRDQLRVVRRIVAEIYMAERAQLIADLESYGHMKATAFGDWDYYDGQEGGTFFRPVDEGRPTYVAAHSALRATWGPNWDQDGAVYIF